MNQGQPSQAQTHTLKVITVRYGCDHEIELALTPELCQHAAEAMKRLYCPACWIPAWLKQEQERQQRIAQNKQTFAQSLKKTP